MGYKVLWIDDDYSIVDAYQTIAEEEYNIDLIHMGNWEDGKKYLTDNFNEITYRIVGRHYSDIQYSKYFGIYELLIADIVDLCLTNEQEKELHKLKEFFA
jgi:hypothetical protein